MRRHRESAYGDGIYRVNLTLFLSLYLSLGVVDTFYLFVVIYLMTTR